VKTTANECCGLDLWIIDVDIKLLGEFSNVAMPEDASLSTMDKGRNFIPRSNAARRRREKDQKEQRERESNTVKRSTNM
jgi:hypothetical protein